MGGRSRIRTLVSEKIGNEVHVFLSVDKQSWRENIVSKKIDANGVVLSISN
jgi:hypothetical protein